MVYFAHGSCGCRRPCRLSNLDIDPPDENLEAKPVIYLYPEEETEVSVTLGLRRTLTATWPAYEDGWQVTAQPDGTLHEAAGNEYSYLFWEGESDTVYDFSKAFA